MSRMTKIHSKTYTWAHYTKCGQIAAVRKLRKYLCVFTYTYC